MTSNPPHLSGICTFHFKWTQFIRRTLSWTCNWISTFACSRSINQIRLSYATTNTRSASRAPPTRFPQSVISAGMRTHTQYLHTRCYAHFLPMAHTKLSALETSACNLRHREISKYTSVFSHILCRSCARVRVCDDENVGDVLMNSGVSQVHAIFHKVDCSHFILYFVLIRTICQCGFHFVNNVFSCWFDVIQSFYSK